MPVDTTRLAEMLTAASPAVQDHVARVLEQDAADRAWGRQIGPSLSQADVARLLGVSVQAVSKSRALLRLRNGDGRPVYPVLQFDGRRPLVGIADVLALLDGPLLPLTITSWLTTPKRDLDGRTPVQALQDGNVDEVLALARQTASAAA